MPRPLPNARRAPLVLALLVLLAGAGGAPAAAAPLATPPTPHSLYRDGAMGRYLLGGRWLFRLDRRDRGRAAHWERATSSAGWREVSVPYAWNARDDSRAAYVGAPAWYRRDFTLPAATPATTGWRVRFESVDYRATVWLNGRALGTHAGAYLPFELPLIGLRPGVNRLVVRTDNRRRATDFPPLQFSREGEPRGGWWNYGGLTREVELRRIDGLDLLDVEARPSLRCRSCGATVALGATVRNASGQPQAVRLAGTVGSQQVRFPAVTLGPGATQRLTATARIAHPRLWWPSAPRLYPVDLRASGSAGGATAEYRLHVGIRSVAVRGGRLLLNGVPVRLRGVGVHEDVPGRGEALTNGDRLALVRSAQRLGATILRSHHPLHPELLQLADERGLLVWDEIPVYRMSDRTLTPGVRRAAVAELRRAILTDRNHPSVIVWSIGNELDPRAPAPVRAYIAQAAAAARALDPSRPVGMALESHRGLECVRGYGPLGVLGYNDYFGWYKDVGPRSRLSPFLDRVRRCHRRQAIMVAEFGAEANRPGPASEKGTYAFQRSFARSSLRTMDSKHWLSGVLYWTLREFRCRPGWNGGNPHPHPPLHQKGLLTYDGARPKPAWFDVRRAFRAIAQVPGEPRR